MSFETTVKSLFVVVLVVFALAPLIAWLERKQGAWMQGRTAPSRVEVGGVALAGWLHGVAGLLKSLAKQDVAPPGTSRWLHGLAPFLAVLPALAAFAVIPFAGVYALDGRTLSLVASDADWGMLTVLVIAALSVYAPVLAGWASADEWSLMGALRAAAQLISYQVALGLSLVGVFMVFGTLKLQAIAVAQDATLPLFGAIEPLLATRPAWLDWVRVPAWGIVLQPVAFVTFLVCMLAATRQPPFDLAEAGDELAGGAYRSHSGTRLGLVGLAQQVRVAVVAGVTTTLFLGGWSLPWLSTEQVIGCVAGYLGTGFATGLCVLLHFGAFLAKLVAVVWLQLALRWTLPRLRYDQLMDLCWRRILPLALANLLVTGGVLVWIGSAS